MNFGIFFYRILALVLLLAAGGCAYIDSKQGEWIFRPTEAVWLVPEWRAAD